jgi:hypothetical protein
MLGMNIIPGFDLNRCLVADFAGTIDFDRVDRIVGRGKEEEP